MNKGWGKGKERGMQSGKKKERDERKKERRKKRKKEKTFTEYSVTFLYINDHFQSSKYLWNIEV